MRTPSISIPFVHDGCGWRLVRTGEDAHLLQRLGQGVAVVGVAGHGAHAHHQAFFERGGDADLHAKLVGRPGLTFADALHLGRVQGVQLVLVFGALAQDAASALQQVLDFDHLGQHVQLTGYLAVHPAHAGAQCAHRFAHALELLGMRIAPDLCGQAGGYAVVILAQPQAVVLGRLDQVLAALVQQPVVARVGDGLGHDGGVHDHLLQA